MNAVIITEVVRSCVSILLQETSVIAILKGSRSQKMASLVKISTNVMLTTVTANTLATTLMVDMNVHAHKE